jgi:hypothetical protein
MTAVAFLALALAVTVQSARLQQAFVREERLRAEAEFQRAQAEVRFRQTRAFLDQSLSEATEQRRQLPPAAPKP